MRQPVFRLAAFIVLIGFSGCYVALPAVEGDFERTLTVAGPVTLDVANGSGSVDVKAGGSGLVRVRGIIKARDGWGVKADEKVRYLQANPPIEQNGDVIRVGRLGESAYANNVSISYEIETPHDTNLNMRTGSGVQKVRGLSGRVDAATGSGSIKVDSVRGDVSAQTGSGGIEVDSVTGRADLKTGSGSIRALGIAGSVRASTGSGGITLELSAAEEGLPADVEARTGSGGIDVSGIAGSLRASTGSGSIKAGGNPKGNWSIEASSGSVSLVMSPDAAFDLHARTASGGIHFERALDFDGSLSRKEARGKFRGGGNLVEVRTGSGGIAIR